MDMPDRTPTLRDLGELVSVETHPNTVRGMPGGSVQHVNWVPNSAILRIPHDAVQLQFSVVTMRDGTRQIVPRCGSQQFLNDAVGLGLSVLFQRPEFTPEYRHSYGLMTTIFRAWSFSPRRMKSREIDRTERLRLRRSESEEDSVRDVLPELDLNQGKKVQSNVSRLLKLGRQAARDREISKPSVTQLILLGMFEAAHGDENNHLLTPEISDGILRLVHLGTDSGTPPDNGSERTKIREAVNEAISRIYDKHDDDLQRRTEDFDSIRQRVARKLGLGTDKIKFVMMELLWESFAYASQCVQQAMSCVRDSLEPALNEKENRIFAIWYEPRPWFGQLVPVVLHTRLPALSIVIPEMTIGQAHEDQIGPEFLQGLEWYSQLVDKRRKADRQQKNSATWKRNRREAFDNRRGTPASEGSSGTDEAG